MGSAFMSYFFFSPTAGREGAVQRGFPTEESSLSGALPDDDHANAFHGAAEQLWKPESQLCQGNLTL